MKFQDDISMPIHTYGQAETYLLPTFSKLGAKKSYIAFIRPETFEKVVKLGLGWI